MGLSSVGWFASTLGYTIPGDGCSYFLLVDFAWIFDVNVIAQISEGSRKIRQNDQYKQVLMSSNVLKFPISDFRFSDPAFRDAGSAYESSLVSRARSRAGSAVGSRQTLLGSKKIIR